MAACPKPCSPRPDGDVFSRVMVRVKEVFDSLSMIEFALDNLPDTPLLTEGFSYQPHKFALGYVGSAAWRRCALEHAGR